MAYGKNNLSRALCTRYIEKNGYKRVGSKNVFQTPDGKIWCYTIASPTRTCRQFYAAADGLCIDGERFIPRDELTFKSKTRISGNGEVAFNVVYPEA